MEEKLLELLMKLQDTISKIAPQVWEIYVRQQIIYGMLGLILTIVLLVVFLYALKKTLYFINKHSEVSKLDYNSYDEKIRLMIKKEEYSTRITQFEILAGVAILFMTLTVSEALRLFNPQYYALQELIKMLK